MSCIPVAAQDLVNKYNVFNILPDVIASRSDKEECLIQSNKPALIAPVVRILASLWQSTVAPKDKMIPLRNRLKITYPLKRKCEDGNIPAKKKRKGENSTTDKEPSKMWASKDPSAEKDGTEKCPSQSDIVLNPKIGRIERQRKLYPMFVEEYLNCLLHIAPEVLEHATSEVSSQYLVLITKLVESVLEVSSWENDVLHALVLGPEVFKERVSSFSFSLTFLFICHICLSM